jgi:thiol:disulfide interchange protein DsbD
MNKFVFFAVLWLLNLSSGFAAIPTINVHVNRLNTHFPVQYEIAITIPDQHHAYLDKGDEQLFIPITFDTTQSLANAGFSIEKLEKPTGLYDNDVKATVLRGTGKFYLTLSTLAQQAPTANSVPISIKYQICNDITKQCFRPQTTFVDLNLPLSQSLRPNLTPSSNDPQNFTDTLLNLFKDNQHNILVIFALMFLAGLLSVATPCVYPMLPITAMFILNRAGNDKTKEYQHACVYVFGMIITYMFLGLIAGMTGGAFNNVMQSAWVNLAFALFFAFFAIALFGYYELSLMQNEVHSLDQQSSNVKGLGGTWLMGLVAGLVISPCVGPIVFALLLQVADNIADKTAALALVHQTLSLTDKLLISLQGSLMMSGFGLGVSVPFFIISVVKFKQLPKSGYWMNKIKYAFGFLILYFAYNYLNKAIGILGVESDTSIVLVAGIIGIWIAVVECRILSLLPSDASNHQRLKHFIGVLTLLVGVWLVLLSLNHLPILKNSAPSPNVNGMISLQKMPEVEAGITWYRHFETAQKIAIETKKPIFIDFYASWCANCVAFKEATKSNSALNDALRTKAVALKLVDKEADFEAFREKVEHRQLKIGLPYFAILKSDGSLVWSTTDYLAIDKMIAVLNENQS